jgi:hypothetical protein
MSHNKPLLIEGFVIYIQKRRFILSKKFKIGDKVVFKRDDNYKNRLFQVCKLWVDNQEIPIYELCPDEENHSHKQTSKIFAYETEIKINI